MPRGKAKDKSKTAKKTKARGKTSARKKAAPKKTRGKSASKRTVAKRKGATRKDATKRKTTARKKTGGKTAARKATTKTRAVSTRAPSKTAVTGKPFSKSDIKRELSETTGLTKMDIGNVFDHVHLLIARHVKKGGVGSFTIPGLCKIVVVHKPAVKARPGTNPFTGEPMMFKAKPARRVVKIRPLKNLKDMAA